LEEGSRLGREERLRVYFLGYSDPDQQVAKDYFAPEPLQSAGNILWSMVHEETGISMTDWRSGTQRNVLDPTIRKFPDDVVSRSSAAFLTPMLLNRIVVLIGAKTGAAMNHRYDPFVWSKEKPWVLIPKISLESMFYRNPTNRVATGAFLAQVIEEAKAFSASAD